MTDVDSIRWMASEHDLEFVDLDNYGVDPAAGEILSEELARRHNMVAIKRKFGTPVIATADPDDLYAQDSVRASIGRDFISVVASPDQIGSYLDRLFGPGPGRPELGDVAMTPLPDGMESSWEEDLNSQVNEALGDRPGIEGQPVGSDLDAYTELATEDLSPEGPVADLVTIEGDNEPGAIESEGAEAIEAAAIEMARGEESGIDSVVIDGAAIEGAAIDADDGGWVPDQVAVDGSAVADVALSEDQGREDPAPEPTSTGKGRRGEKKRRKAATDAGPDGDDNRRWEGSTVEEPTVEVVASGVDEQAPPNQDGTTGSDGFEQVTTDFELPGGESGSAGEFAGLVEGTEPGFENLEPATSILPDFGSDRAFEAPTATLEGSGDPLTASADQLAELAFSLQTGDQAGGDEAVIAADLVDEAVATYQEQLGEEQRFEVVEPFNAPSGTAMFPALAKALVDGERVSLEDMETVLEEHYQTGQSIARILTAQKLVTEADLMWGMAQEMGLEFVDLDMVGGRPGRGRDHPRGDRPPSQRDRHRQRQRHPGRGRLESHRRVRHGRPAHHHGSELHRGGGHPLPDQRLHRPGLQQRWRRRRHGHGGVAGDRGRSPSGAASTTSRPSPKRRRSSAT